jgi:hypothetical protein
MSSKTPTLSKRGRPHENLTGLTTGILTVTGPAPQRSGHTYWYADCGCGNRVTRQTNDLKNGRAKSCGCLRGMSGSKASRDRKRLYNIHAGFLGRCTNPNDNAFHNYGGRGITVCQEWLDDVEVFIDWALSNGHDQSLTLDRRDNDLGYSPKNCRWITPAEQARNRRSTVLTHEQADAIKELLALGAPSTVIARAGGFRPHLVYNIKNNGAWS